MAITDPILRWWNGAEKAPIQVNEPEGLMREVPDGVLMVGAPEAKPVKSCATCICWTGGECHANPPAVVFATKLHHSVSNAIGASAVWPRTRGGDWCERGWVDKGTPQ